MIIPGPRLKRRARIEIIPLIDIIFFLLATFVMVSLSLVMNRGVPVNLPRSESGARELIAEFTTLSITRDGALFLDRERVTLEQLPDRLEQLKAAHSGDPRVLIHGDEEAKLGHAISVLDECRRRGIARVTFQTRP
jgi:biopolymer transport protein ExbD